MDLVGGEGLLLLLCVLFPICFSAFQLHKKRRKLPPGPTPWLFVGNLLQKDVFPLHNFYEKLKKKYGPIFTVWTGTKPMVVLCGYEVVKDALVDHSEEFGGRAPIHFGGHIFLSQGSQHAKISPQQRISDHSHHQAAGLSNINETKWRQMRRFTLSTLRDFGMGKKTMSEKVQEEAACLVEEIAATKGQAFDPRSDVLCAVSNVICSVVFGTRYDYKDLDFQEHLKFVEDFNYSFNSYFGLIYNTFPKMMDLLPGPYKKIVSDGRKLLACFQERVEAHKRTLDPQNPRDYIDCFLIKIKKEQNSAEDIFSPEEIVPNVFALFTAGSVSTSSTLLYSLCVMAKFPHIQAKVQEEIDDVVGESRAPGMEDRVRLPFTNAVVHEILRYQKLNVENFPRETTCNTVFRGFTIPQNTSVVPLLPSVHLDPLQWETPDEFNPGHFLDEKGGFRPRDALMPFSAGKRSCPGEALARVEIFLFFSTLLQNFTFQLAANNTERDLLSSYEEYKNKGVYPQLRAIKRSL